MSSTANPFEVLVGRQMGAVTFVQDYVQLAFDGPGITILEFPTIMVGTERYTLAEPGYRDRLCGLIAHIVTRTEFIDNVSIIIVFDNEAGLYIPIDEAAHIYGPESVIFNNDAGGTWVW